MIKELIFNKSRWLNIPDTADGIVISDKRYIQLPAQVIVTSEYATCTNIITGRPSQPVKGTVSDVYGDAIDCWVIKGTDGKFLSINKGACSPYGGGNSPL